MMQAIVLLSVIATAFAGVLHAPAPILTKSIHHAPALTPVTTYQRTVQAVHHPSVTTLHEAPTSVIAKAPKLSGYSYTSDVRHDATALVAHAAPVVAHAAPVVAHAAPVAVAHAAPVAVAHAAPVAAVAHAGYAHAGYAHAAPVAAVAHAAPVAAVAHAPGPIVSAASIHAAPVAIKETPAFSSYAIETGRTHVATQAHYAKAYVPGVVNVPAVKTVHAAPVLAAAPVVHAGYGHAGYGHY